MKASRRCEDVQQKVTKKKPPAADEAAKRVPPLKGGSLEKNRWQPLKGQPPRVRCRPPLKKGWWLLLLMKDWPPTTGRGQPAERGGRGGVREFRHLSSEHQK